MCGDLKPGETAAQLVLHFTTNQSIILNFSYKNITHSNLSWCMPWKKHYYINSLDKLDSYWDEMVKLCNLFNARLVINLNPRSFEKAAYGLLIKLSNQLRDKDYYGVRKGYDSICGEYHKEIDKRWIIDLDRVNENDKEWEEKVKSVSFVINSLQTENKGTYKILAEIPSKSGMHIISNPFNINEFQKLFPDIDIHKNNPTNLYIV